jgi:hypothetical protein
VSEKVSIRAFEDKPDHVLTVVNAPPLKGLRCRNTVAVMRVVPGSPTTLTVHGAVPDEIVKVAEASLTFVHSGMIPIGPAADAGIGTAASRKIAARRTLMVLFRVRMEMPLSFVI